MFNIYHLAGQTALSYKLRMEREAQIKNGICAAGIGVCLCCSVSGDSQQPFTQPLLLRMLQQGDFSLSLV